MADSDLLRLLIGHPDGAGSAFTHTFSGVRVAAPAGLTDMRMNYTPDGASTCVLEFASAADRDAFARRFARKRGRRRLRGSVGGRRW